MDRIRRKYRMLMESRRRREVLTRVSHQSKGIRKGLCRLEQSERYSVDARGADSGEDTKLSVDLQPSEFGCEKINGQDSDSVERLTVAAQSTAQASSCTFGAEVPESDREFVTSQDAQKKLFFVSRDGSKTASLKAAENVATCSKKS